MTNYDRTRTSFPRSKKGTKGVLKMSNEKAFGRLESVDVRELWKHEQYDFSAWLSKPENIDYLSEELGLTLTDIQTEVFVGSYRCDIVAKDETSGIQVVIENQLEASNHDHLGKIITYASGLNASVIVWIVTEAKEEHRSAIEWLNNHTSQEISFFLIELHAYKIGDSLPAPKFEVIEKPNDFIKYNKVSKDEGDSVSRARRFEFWTKFNEVLIESGKPFNIRKPSTDHWYDVAIGTSSAHIAINLVNKGGKIVLELYIPDDKPLFDMLHEQQAEIESELGMSFEWERLDKKKASRIKYDISGLNFDDQSNYPELMEQVIECVKKMRHTFQKRIKAY